MANPMQELKSHFECPISLEPMQNPWMAIPCGHTFERSSIEEWIKSNPTCPLDRSPIESIIENHTLKSLIDKINAIPEDDPLVDQVEKLKEEILQLRRQSTQEFSKKKEEEEKKLRLSFEKTTDIGIYFLGNCQNSSCKKVNQSTWINKGNRSVDNLNKETRRTRCSSCSEAYEDINTMVIRSLKYCYDGQKRTGENFYKEVSSDYPSVTIFPQLSEWRFIDVKIY
ncbi:U-box domain-containing protein [Candidatus Neptunichlamydia sp. REUL1]|uniref:U-box domain-containing protein n=1 Tax=Candidatus Neptunichlamydia sp. REUL1 TaxID=3064277 RepID=UPI002931A76F|nr:U-box domain-containing protein [Candidatus Neptunochlamydia sp. REUL1]